VDHRPGDPPLRHPPKCAAPPLLAPPQLTRSEVGCGDVAADDELLLRHLDVDTEFTTATFLIDVANERSMALAERIGCGAPVDFDGNRYYKRPVRPYR
jgi:hypothetical protein